MTSDLRGQTVAKQCEVDSLISWVKDPGREDYRSSQVSQRSRCHSCPPQTWRRPCWVTALPRTVDWDKDPEYVKDLQTLDRTPWSPHGHLTSVALEGDEALWVVGWPGWSCGLVEGLAALEAAGSVSPRELERDVS